MSNLDPAWGLLLDLDDTLVLSSALDLLRRQRAWQEVYRSLGQTTLPVGTAAFLAAVRPLARLGVVTMSPRPYAEKLLAHHRLDLPVLVAYHDVIRRKPDPEPIVKAAKQLGVPTNRCMYVGDRQDDITAAARAGAVPIGLSWDRTLAVPPGARRAVAICSTWDEVFAVVTHVVQSA